MLSEIYEAIDVIQGFNDLYELYDETGHAVLAFDDLKTDIEHHLGIWNWKKSVHKKTPISFSDKEIIWNYMEVYADQLEKNEGILDNKQILNKILKKISHRVTLSELKDIIKLYWFDNDELESEEDDDDDDDDDDEKENEIDLTKLPSKYKKISELKNIFLCKLFVNLNEKYTFIIYIYIVM